jgi:hypothetical protein
VRISTSMTSLRLNFAETVFVPLITELLSLAKAGTQHQRERGALRPSQVYPSNKPRLAEVSLTATSMQAARAPQIALPIVARATPPVVPGCT